MIVVAALIAALLILIMVKLSELNGRLTAQGAVLDAIKTAVEKPKDDPMIPADAEATLDANDAKLAAINAVLNPPPAP